MYNTYLKTYQTQQILTFLLKCTFKTIVKYKLFLRTYLLKKQEEVLLAS